MTNNQLTVLFAFVICGFFLALGFDEWLVSDSLSNSYTFHLKPFIYYLGMGAILTGFVNFIFLMLRRN